MKNDSIEENKMGVMPIPRLLITMSLPMMLSMLVQALYNIVDSIFVAKLNEEALTAVSLAFPVQNLMIAIAVGTGVGINALLSRYLGEKNQTSADRVAQNGIFVSILSYIVFGLSGALCSGWFFRMQTSDPLIIKYGTEYMLVVTLFSISIFMQITLERLMQSTGKTFYNMVTQGLGAVINIILDPILIFGLFGMPRLEVLGAAIATITGQVVAVLLSLYLNCTRNKEIHLNMRHFRPHMPTIVNIYKIGIPSIIMQSLGSVMTFGLNKTLLGFSSTAAAVLGIYFKLQSFVYMPIFGINNGLIPIIAYNYGAKKSRRIVHSIWIATGISLGIMVVGLVLFQLLPTQLLQMFDASDRMLSIGIPALKIISLSFLFAGYSIIISSVFQALGNGIYSLITTSLRQLVIVLPAAWLLARYAGLDAVWWAIPAAEAASVILSTILLKRIYTKCLKPMAQD